MYVSYILIYASVQHIFRFYELVVDQVYLNISSNSSFVRFFRVSPTSALLHLTPPHNDVPPGVYGNIGKEALLHDVVIARVIRSPKSHMSRATYQPPSRHG